MINFGSFFFCYLNAMDLEMINLSDMKMNFMHKITEFWVIRPKQKQKNMTSEGQVWFNKVYLAQHQRLEPPI